MKKKLLAGLLSFTMLTAEVLPVIAADDAVVSENAVVEEDAVEEDAAEEEVEEAELTPEEEAIFDNLDIGESYTVQDGDCTITYTIAPAEGILVSSDADTENSYTETLYDASSPTYMYAAAEKTATLNAGTFDINGSPLPVNASITYYSHISYRAKKIKAEKLNIRVTSSGLYDIASALAYPGSYTGDVFKWKFTMKNNKNVNYAANPKKDAYFTVKASVNTKNAKNAGITGKSLKALKKAVKQFNKAAKQAVNRVPFVIDPVNLDQIFDSGNYICGNLIVTYKNSWGLTWTKNLGWQFRVRLDEDQPVKIDGTQYKKWTKPSKKDVNVKKGTVVYQGVTYNRTITPLAKNYVGSIWYFK